MSLMTCFNNNHQGFSRLQKLGVTVCKAVTNRKIAEVSLSYSKKVKAWRANVENKNKDPPEEVHVVGWNVHWIRNSNSNSNFLREISYRNAFFSFFNFLKIILCCLEFIKMYAYVGPTLFCSLLLLKREKKKVLQWIHHLKIQVLAWQWFTIFKRHLFVVEIACRCSYNTITIILTNHWQLK